MSPYAHTLHYYLALRIQNQHTGKCCSVQTPKRQIACILGRRLQSHRPLLCVLYLVKAF